MASEMIDKFSSVQYRLFLGNHGTQVGPLSRVSSRDQLSRGLELQGTWLTAGTQRVAYSLGLNQTTLKPELRLGLMSKKPRK